MVTVIKTNGGYKVKLRGKLGILILRCAVTVVILLTFLQKEPYSTEEVMESLWVNHNVQSTMIGDTDLILDVSVYNEEDINKVESYLQNNLSDKDLDYYKLNVYEWSSDPKEFRENAQENSN